MHASLSPMKISRRMALIVVAAFALLATACGNDGDLAATASGFVIEPSDEVGPDAFTAAVDTAPVGDESTGGCDKDALIKELESRPDAHREWAAVLGIPEDQVADYINSLQPKILEADTDVTNHGLHDGAAYSRPSQLPEGTAVLVDTNFTRGSVDVQIPSTAPTTITTTTEETTTTGAETTTTVPGAVEQPVTRCKCGNPLLPPYEPSTTPQITVPTTPTTTPDTSSTTSTSSTSTTSTTSSTTSTTTSTTPDTPSTKPTPNGIPEAPPVGPASPN